MMSKTIWKMLTTAAFMLLCGLLLAGCSKETPEEEVRKQVDSRQEAEPADTSEISEENAYVSPVDFDHLYEQNEDICAWLDIPGTNISYPILKDDEEEGFYLKHDSLGEESASGSLFLDSYNERDFEDPVTVIYGHHMKSGAYFGELQSYYSNLESFLEHQKIKLYLPNEERDYLAFAAVPYDKIHILYNYDFRDMTEHYVFFDRIYGVRSLVSVTIPELYPIFGEKVLILSTCLEGDNTQRYLVLAKEVTNDEEE